MIATHNERIGDSRRFLYYVSGLSSTYEGINVSIMYKSTSHLSRIVSVALSILQQLFVLLEIIS